MAVEYEAWNKASHRQSVSGGTGHREFQCPWELRLSVAPAIGDPFPGVDDLRCSDVQFNASGPEQPTVTDPETGDPCKYSIADIIAEYAEMPRIESQLTWEYDGALELLSTGVGSIWSSDGAACEQQLVTPYSQVVCRCTRVVAANPISLVMPKVNTINWSYFKPSINSPRFHRETLLCMEPNISEWYDYERSRLLGRPIYLYRLTLNFLWRPVSHNLDWRSGVGWDEILPRKYELADFNPLVGLPPNFPGRFRVHPNDGQGGTGRIK